MFAAFLLAQAVSLPRELTAAACTRPPTIDGRLADGEWDPAAPAAFDLELAGTNPPATDRRRCRLRAMNSANALYLALELPDPTANGSLSPLDMDAAFLAFARGDKPARGDDRKAIGGGFYIDKHVTDPGQDADDARQDGRGAAVHRDGGYVYEWAVPLDSGDAQDLRARPGDTLRFTIAVFDGFRPELMETLFGGLYGAGMDDAAGWGRLTLARDVTDDGGAAFRGPAWIEAAFKDAPRLKIVESAAIAGGGRAVVEVAFRDAAGRPAQGKARVLLPERAARERVPLLFSAGYELPEAGAAGYLKRGWAVATPCSFAENPLFRTVNPDAAALHALRALVWVDDARVMITGGSAGGWATLMLAAEQFPLAGIAPDVPPVNLGYNCAYFLKQKMPGTPPILGAVRPLAEGCLRVYGPDFDDAVWFAQSPLAHLSTISCPVSIVWSTADVLVPIDQVGASWVRPAPAGTFPEGFTMEPARLMGSAEGRRTLAELLPESEYEAFVVALPKGAGRQGTASKEVALPVSAAKRWSIVIVEEGAPDMATGHTKHQLHWNRDEFWKRVLERPLGPEQLTAAKLERLMDRYAGREWAAAGSIAHLDAPEAERADVLRGLRTYVAAGPGHARRFAELYAALPAERKVLEPERIKELAR